MKYIVKKDVTKIQQFGDGSEGMEFKDEIIIPEGTEIELEGLLEFDNTGIPCGKYDIEPCGSGGVRITNYGLTDIMTNEQILKKAIKKAELNGFDYCIRGNSIFEIANRWHYDEFTGCLSKPGFNAYHINEIIFNHDFAKAFWGELEIPIINKYNDREDEIAWKFQLQQMVLAEDPIKYLEKYVKNYD